MHGGGFEGTILVLLPLLHVDDFKKYISGIFNNYSILDLSIRHHGAVSVLDV